MSFHRLRCRALNSLAFVAVAGCLPLYPRPRPDLFEASPVNEGASYPAPACAAELPADQNGVLFDMPHIDQSAPFTERGSSKVCWAANIAMVSTFLGNPRATCQVASYMSRDGLSCCRLTQTSPKEEKERCNAGVFNSHIRSTFNQLGMYVLHADKPLSEDALRLELSNGRPVVLQMKIAGWVDGHSVLWGHVAVIAGFRKDGTYLVHDPSKDAPNDMTYTELLHGKERPWEWYESWYHVSFRQDGCNPRFRPDCDVCR